jgi:hypothetical protein
MIIPATIPPGTDFVSIDEVDDFEIDARLRMLRNPQKPQEGLAAITLIITSKSPEKRQNVQAAVWLPEGVRKFTPLNVIGTNLEKWRVDLSPEQPKMALDSSFGFENPENTGPVLEAFQGPTRVKVTWEGGERYFQFPGSAWKVEKVSSTP